MVIIEPTKKCCAHKNVFRPGRYQRRQRKLGEIPIFESSMHAGFHPDYQGVAA